MVCLIYQENLKCFRQDSVLRSTPQILTSVLCPFLTRVSNATKNYQTCRGRALLDHINLRQDFAQKDSWTDSPILYTALP